jgi:hypothetical protein
MAFATSSLTSSSSSLPTIASSSSSSSSHIPRPWHIRHTLSIPNTSPHYHCIYQSPTTGFKLLVGDLVSANDRSTIQSEKITHIVNCCAASCGTNETEWMPFKSVGVKYSILFTDDHFASSNDILNAKGADTQDPRSQWPDAMNLLKDAHKEGTVALVHCAWGINRSVTTAAVFMALHGLAPSFDIAVLNIKKERKQAGPLKQYRLWAEQFIQANKIV